MNYFNKIRRKSLIREQKKSLLLNENKFFIWFDFYSLDFNNGENKNRFFFINFYDKNFFKRNQCKAKLKRNLFELYKTIYSTFTLQNTAKNTKNPEQSREENFQISIFVFSMDITKNGHATR